MMVDHRGLRAFTRVPVHIDAEARADDGTGIRGVLNDVSLRGLSLATRGTLPVGTECTIRIPLRPGGDPLVIDARGIVVRSSDGLVAFDITAVDADDFEHLQKLVLYNAPSAGEIEEEIEVRADDQPELTHLDAV